jgi:endonuclease/exonuclease/phosphatase (EEP) superfamily protein YafD
MLRFDRLLVTATFATAFGIVAGFFGGVLPLLDTLGQFRAHGSVVLAVLALAMIVRRFFAAGFAALLTAGLGLYTVLPFMLPLSQTADGILPRSMPRYSLLQMNLRYDTQDKAGAIQRILDLDPDVVTVQEMTEEWETAFQGILERYPFQSYCAPPRFHGDVAILSRRPFLGGAQMACLPKASFEARVVDFDGHPVAIGAQHLRWPWPGRQWRQVADVETELPKLPTPLLVAGDFNAAPWSASIARYAAAGSLRILAGIGPTWAPDWLPSFVARWSGFPIDNVLVSPDVLVLSVTRPEATESDHLPVLVTFAIPFPKPVEPEVQSVERR